MSPSTRSYYACLAGAFLLTVLAAVLGLVTVPGLLHRPGVSLGPLLILGVFAVELVVFGWLEWRR